MFLVWLIIETSDKAHTPLSSLQQGKACKVLQASCVAVFIISAISQRAEQPHSQLQCCCTQGRTSLWGMLREVCSRPGDASFSFIWLQQVEPSGFNETPEGKLQCSVTYLAGEEEALAKRKGKTLYTHKLHGRGLGGWFSLINRKGTERQSWRRAAHTGEEYNTCRRRHKSTAGFPDLSCKWMLFFSS